MHIACLEIHIFGTALNLEIPHKYLHQNFMLCEAQKVYNLHNEKIYELKEVFVFFFVAEQYNAH